MDMVEAAESIAERARQGDQVAMAGIVMVREDAAKGNPRAKNAFNLIKQYVLSHPVTETRSSTMHGERLTAVITKFKTFLSSHLNPKRYVTAVFGAVPLIADSKQSAITLANGPTLLVTDREEAPINLIRRGFQNAEELQAFEHGLEYCKQQNELRGYQSAADNIQRALEIGKSVGLAQSIQRVRLPDTPISPFSRAAGWEHGE